MAASPSDWMNPSIRIYLIFILPMLVAGCAGNVVTRQPDIPVLQYPDGLTVVTRESWGWQKNEATLTPHVIDKITIHHGGEDFPADKDPVEYLRHLQSWSRSEKNWIDIPYHFMIDLKGVVYETRPINLPGDTNTGYDTRGHALVCVMGNYENQTISRDQLTALIRLTALLVRTFGVPVDSIKGHKDYSETLCPGKDLYRYLQDRTIHRGVQEILLK